MRVWSVLLAIAIASATAHADYAPITNRDYSIELYDGVALGNSATIAMGGASVAYGNGSSGTLNNAAASAIQSTTEHDRWSWDYHFDYLNSSLSTDYDNNGIVASQGGDTSAITGGLSVRRENLALALTISTETSRIDGAMTATGSDLYAATTRAQFAVAYFIPYRDLAIGAGIVAAQFGLTAGCASCDQLFQISGAGLEAGAVWIPKNENLRIGGSLTTPVVGGNVDNASCDPNNCQGYILPTSVVAPGRARIGAAYRLAPSAWNQNVVGDFRDEDALLLVADLWITGPSKNAFGLEAFGQHELQPAGLSTSVSLRGGAEYEIMPGRLRLRAGSYWEPGRFEGVGGRIHGTFGTELRFLEFSAWGQRRFRITLTGDVARHYRNVGVSIGFWH